MRIFHPSHIGGDNINCTQLAAAAVMATVANRNAKKKMPNKLTLAFFANKNDFKRNTEKHIDDLICNNFEFAAYFLLLFATRKKH